MGKETYSPNMLLDKVHISKFIALTFILSVMTLGPVPQISLVLVLQLQRVSSSPACCGRQCWEGGVYCQ